VGSGSGRDDDGSIRVPFDVTAFLADNPEDGRTVFRPEDSFFEVLGNFSACTTYGEEKNGIVFPATGIFEPEGGCSRPTDIIGVGGEIRDIFSPRIRFDVGNFAEVGCGVSGMPCPSTISEEEKTPRTVTEGTKVTLNVADFGLVEEMGDSGRFV